MFDPSTPGSSSHPIATLWLDVADKVIKLLAVFVGAAWTWMNFKRSRTYAQKLELQLSGAIVNKVDRYVEVSATLKNLGASRHEVQKEGTGCEILAVMKDLSERSINVFPAFEDHEWIEPGESIGDSMISKIPIPSESIVWIKIHLRVVSNDIEWKSRCLVEMT